MRRPDHGTPLPEAGLVVTDQPTGGLVDLSWSAMPMLALLFGGAIVVMRRYPARLLSATASG
jgi:hypothetical protein